MLAFFVSLAVTSSAFASFGIEAGSVKTKFELAEGVNGVPQASSHPYAFTISFALNTNSEGLSEGGELRDVLIDLPPGLVGNPRAVPECSRQEFEGFLPLCPADSQIGLLTAVTPGPLGEVSGAIFNMVPPPGVAAQLGFSTDGLNALQDASLRSRSEGYGLRVTTNGLPLEVTGVTATIWGTPAAEGHDHQRNTVVGGKATPYVGVHTPFLTLPASCGEPLKTTISIDSTLEPGNFFSASTELLGAGGDPATLPGCEAVPFKPSSSTTPTGLEAAKLERPRLRLEVPERRPAQP